MRLQQQRRECRRQRQRNQQRDHRRSRNRHRELVIEGARKPVEEQGRQEHRAQHENDRDQRRADFVHRRPRRLQPGEAAGEVSLDILDHDDGVVDDDADRQHQPEQRQVVERIADRQKHREGADQRYRNGDHRNHRRAPALQEDDDDQHDQRNRFQQRVHHGVDRLRDELGRVVDDPVFEPRREGLRRGLHLGLDRCGRGERVRSRPLEDAEEHRRLARQIGVRRVIGGAELDPCRRRRRAPDGRRHRCG